MRCDECKHWESEFVDVNERDNGYGICIGIFRNSRIELLTSNYDGGCYVDEVTTDSNFFCANFESLSEDKESSIAGK